MITTAAVARIAGAPFSIEQVVLDEPRAGEILVRIAGVGICHSDLNIRDRAPAEMLPWVLGHEGSGIVVDVGENITKVAPGDAVVLSFNSCGHCHGCISDHPAYCDDFMRLNAFPRRTDGSCSIHGQDGADIGSNFFGQSSFAAHALVNETNVVKVAQDLPIELFGPLGCGFQTGAGAAIRELACKPGSSILILGAGALGMACVMGAAVQGCAQIIVSEPFAVRRALAIELGATHVIDPSSEDIASALAVIAPHGVNYCFDTTGRNDVIAQGLAALGIHGTIALAAMDAEPGTSLPIKSDILRRRGISVRGASEGDSDRDGFICQLIALWQDGKFPFDKLVACYPLAEINRAVEDQLAGRCLKAVLIP